MRVVLSVTCALSVSFERADGVTGSLVAAGLHDCVDSIVVGAALAEADDEDDELCDDFNEAVPPSTVAESVLEREFDAVAVGVGAYAAVVSADTVLTEVGDKVATPDEGAAELLIVDVEPLDNDVENEATAESDELTVELLENDGDRVHGNVVATADCEVKGIVTEGIIESDCAAEMLKVDLAMLLTDDERVPNIVELGIFDGIVDMEGADDIDTVEVKLPNDVTVGVTVPEGVEVTEGVFESEDVGVGAAELELDPVDDGVAPNDRDDVLDVDTVVVGLGDSEAVGETVTRAVEVFVGVIEDDTDVVGVTLEESEILLDLEIEAPIESVAVDEVTIVLAGLGVGEVVKGADGVGVELIVAVGDALVVVVAVIDGVIDNVAELDGDAPIVSEFDGDAAGVGSAVIDEEAVSDDVGDID